MAGVPLFRLACLIHFRLLLRLLNLTTHSPDTYQRRHHQVTLHQAIPPLAYTRELTLPHYCLVLELFNSVGCKVFSHVLTYLLYRELYTTQLRRCENGYRSNLLSQRRQVQRQNTIDVFACDISSACLSQHLSRSNLRSELLQYFHQCWVAGNNYDVTHNYSLPAWGRIPAN